MAERVFADPYEHVRGTHREPCSPADRAVALAMNRGGSRAVSLGITALGARRSSGRQTG